MRSTSSTPPYAAMVVPIRRGRDRHPLSRDEGLQRPSIGVWLLERMESTIFEIAQAWREPPFAEGGNNPKNAMIARTPSVGVMFVDVELRFVVEQVIKNVGRFALARADRQDAEIAILVGEMAIEFRTGLAAVMEVHVASAGGAVTGAEELCPSEDDARATQRAACGWAECASMIRCLRRPVSLWPDV